MNPDLLKLVIFFLPLWINSIHNPEVMGSIPGQLIIMILSLYSGLVAFISLSM